MRAQSNGSETGRPGHRPRLIPAGRRVLALLALYALALQSVLGGLAMAAAAGPEHVLCLTGGTFDRTWPDDPHLPAHEPMACCVACNAAAPVALPAPTLAEAIPVPGPVVLIQRRPARIALPRAPPRTGHHARAPPTVV